MVRVVNLISVSVTTAGYSYTYFCPVYMTFESPLYACLKTNIFLEINLRWFAQAISHDSLSNLIFVSKSLLNFIDRLKLIVEIERQFIVSLCETRSKRQVASISVSTSIISGAVQQASDRIQEVSVWVWVLILKGLKSQMGFFFSNLNFLFYILRLI